MTGGREQTAGAVAGDGVMQRRGSDGGSAAGRWRHGDALDVVALQGGRHFATGLGVLDEAAQQGLMQWLLKRLKVSLFSCCHLGDTQ